MNLDDNVKGRLIKKGLKKKGFRVLKILMTMNCWFGLVWFGAFIVSTSKKSSC